MNHIESMLWCFCMGFILVFMGFYLLISRGFAYSLFIENWWLRILVSCLIMIIGVVLFNLGIHIKKNIKIVQIE